LGDNRDERVSQKRGRGGKRRGGGGISCSMKRFETISWERGRGELRNLELERAVKDFFKNKNSREDEVESFSPKNQ
jgi:hypothetical protein